MVNENNTADGFIESCDLCGSPFDNRVHKLVECADCSAEASTACCISNDLCPECQ